MGIFGESKNEAWARLRDEIGADVDEGGFWKGAKVRLKSGPWTITLDTYTESDGHTYLTYTRMRAPYVNPDGFRFSVYRKGVFTGLGKLFGMQDIEVGDPEFDEAFVLKGNEESRVRELFADPGVRALLTAQPKVWLRVKDSEGWFGPTFPEGVNELCFQAEGVIKDVDRLKGLFDLFAAVLDRLCRVGGGRKEAPGVAL